MAINRKERRQAIGLGQGFLTLSPLPVVAQRAPTNSDVAEIGTIWLDQLGNDVYILLEVIAGSSSWVAIGAGAGIFDSVTSTTFVTAGTTVTAGTGVIATTGGFTASNWTAGTVVSSAAGVLSSQALTNGQVLIGSTGVAPVAATLTAGAGIGIVNAGGSITISAPGGTAVQYTTDDLNIVVPDGGGNVNVVGGVNVGTTGAVANTITINVDNAPTFSGLVTCQAGITQSAGTTTITSDTNAAQAIYLHTNAGVNETIEIYADQGTNSQSIYVHSDVGGVDLTSGLAAANSIRINASNAAGGIDVDAGTGGINITATNGAVSLISGTGAMNIGADAAAHTLTMGSTTGAASTVIQSGTGAMTVTAGGIFDLNATGAVTIDSTGGALSIGAGADAQNINIGTGAAARAITIGNATGGTAFTLNVGTGAVAIASNGTDHNTTLGSTAGTSTLTLQAGTGATTITAGGVFDLNAVGAVTVDSTGGAISIGAGADAFAVNIGTAGARAISIGNGSGATSLTLEAGTGAVAIASNATDHNTTLGSTNGTSTLTLQAGTGAFTSTAGGAYDVNAAGAVTIDSSGSTIGIGTDAVAQNMNIGTGAAARTITIGNNTGATSVVVDVGTGAASFGATATAHTTTLGSTTGAADTIIQSGTGGVTFTSGGLIDPTPDTQTAASPVASVTSNVNIGVATFTGFTTAAAATQQYTVTNSLVAATSGILVSISNLGANDAKVEIQRVTPGAGSFTVDTINNGTQAVNGNVLISFWVLN